MKSDYLKLLYHLVWIYICLYVTDIEMDFCEILLYTLLLCETYDS